VESSSKQSASINVSYVIGFSILNCGFHFLHYNCQIIFSFGSLWMWLFYTDRVISIFELGSVWNFDIHWLECRWEYPLTSHGEEWKDRWGGSFGQKRSTFGRGGYPLL
jgi:hypothetical protein